ncbi:MAG: MFS transporter [Tenacibaculum sp.]
MDKVSLPIGLELISAFVLFFIAGALTATLGASLPMLATYFNLAEPDSSVITIYNLGAFVSVSTIAVWGSKLPLTRLLLFIVIFCLGCGIMSQVVNWTGFITACSIAGMGYGGLVLLLNTACAQGFGLRSVIVVNWLNATFGIGAICGPIVAGILGTDNILVMILAISIVALAGIPSFRLGKVLETTPLQVGNNFKFGKFQPIVLFFLLTGGLYAGLETSIGVWFSTSLSSSGWNLNIASSSVSYFWLGIALGRFVVPLFTLHLIPSVAINSYLAIATVMLTAAVFTGKAIYFYPLAGFAFSPVLPTMFAWIGKLSASPQQLTAILMIVTMLSNAVIPSVVGYFSSPKSPISISLSLLGVCILATLAAFIVYYLMRTNNKNT